MRSFVRRMVSSIKSRLKSSISSLDSWLAGIGSAETLRELSDIEMSPKRRAEAERLFTEFLSMHPSPAFAAGLFCPERTIRPYNKQCVLGNGHEGAHCTQHAHERPLMVTQRIREHGLVHRVNWYYWNDKARCREMHTKCGQFFTTRNRTRNYRTITCLHCLR